MLKALILDAIRRTGYDLLPREHARTLIPLSRRVETVRELEAMYRQFVFPGLPARPDRDRLIARLEGTAASEAIHLVEYLHRSLPLDGDVCEFGVAQGATSALLANEIRETEKRLWLFDSFEGLPRPSEKDVLLHDIFDLGSIGAYEGTMAYGEDHVLGRLHEVGFPLPRAQIVPGFIEKTIENPKLPKSVCFAYVDFDFYEPIRIALEYLDGALPVGGHVVVDDYGWFSAGAQTAVDEFVRAKGNRYELVLPLAHAGHFAVLARRGV